MNVESSSWCAQLITRQRSGACVAPFTSIPRSAHFKFSSDLKSVILNLGGLNTSTPNWMSAQGQDWWVWYNHARFMRRKGIYVDLAANDPIWRSNTFFFDVCMGWSGLCIQVYLLNDFRPSPAKQWCSTTVRRSETKVSTFSTMSS